MTKLTRWQKNMQNAGYQIIPFTHEEIMDHLIDVFVRDREHLTALAAADDTKRHELSFIIDYSNLGDQSTIFGGLVHYNKKQRRFTYITYSDDRNWGVMFSIESRVAFFCYEHYKSLKHLFPFGCSTKKLTEYLLNN